MKPKVASNQEQESKPISSYGVSLKPLQPRPLGETDFFIAAPPVTTNEGDGGGDDEKWRMPKDTRPKARRKEKLTRQRAPAKVVNGVKIRQDGQPYKKKGRKPKRVNIDANNSTDTSSNSTADNTANSADTAAGTSSADIVEVKVEEVTNNDDVPLNCLPMEVENDRRDRRDSHRSKC